MMMLFRCERILNDASIPFKLILQTDGHLLIDVEDQFLSAAFDVLRLAEGGQRLNIHVVHEGQEFGHCMPQHRARLCSLPGMVEDEQSMVACDEFVALGFQGCSKSL